MKEFYPSIKEPLLEKGLKFAEEYTDISTGDKNIIKHPRKWLLLGKRKSWIKKDSGLFDVIMGGFNGKK